MRQITAFLFVLSGEEKETPEGKPGRLEGRMRPERAGENQRWHDEDGSGPAGVAC